jgi:molybdopterin/thiamine biosynthesis adenylyltransferase
MTRKISARIAGVHAEKLREHLFPEDGNEAVAFALCGRHTAPDSDVLLVQEIHPIQYNDCPVRTPERVTWKTHAIEPLLKKAANENLAIIKFHSHPSGLPEFSTFDDESDRDLFESVYGWIDDDGPHASIVLLPGGKYFGRAIDVKNRFFSLDQILVVDHDISLFFPSMKTSIPEHAERHAQFFGEETANILRNLTIGVVGCSGTGSFVIEMLARLGVHKLVLVDPDRVEYRNLNRIVGTTAADAAMGKLKVTVLGESVERMGLHTRIEPIAKELSTTSAIRVLAGCDLLFGCVDSHDARRTLNRLACFYILPYFDCGVGLKADGYGGIEEASVACYYIQPGRSTLQSRKAIQQELADAEALARKNPEEYRLRRKENYIKGVEVDSPAVISINSLAASLVVNEFLARLHRYRSNSNEKFASSLRFNLMEMELDYALETNEEPLSRALGRGDIQPLLDMPGLSAKE